MADSFSRQKYNTDHLAIEWVDIWKNESQQYVNTQNTVNGFIETNNFQYIFF